MLRSLVRSFLLRLLKDLRDSSFVGFGSKTDEVKLSALSSNSLSVLVESSDLVDLLVDVVEKPRFNFLHIFLRVLAEGCDDSGLGRTRSFMTHLVHLSLHVVCHLLVNALHVHHKCFTRRR